MKRPSIFPVVLISLTLLLGLFMIYALTPEAEEVAPAAPSVASYRAFSQEIVSAFFEAEGETASVLSRLSAAQKARDALLALIVPIEEKERHLQMVLGLQMTIEGLQNEDAEAISAGLRRLRVVYDSY